MVCRRCITFARSRLANEDRRVMSARGPEPPAPRNPWVPAFALALATLAGSVVALGYVVLNRDGSAPGAIAAGADGSSATSTATTRPKGAVTFAGALPAGLTVEGLSLEPVAEGKQADISFEAQSGAEEVIHRFFAPVAAIGAGVDSLTHEQLAGLLSGSIRNWADVGGVSGKVEFASGGPEADEALVQQFAGGAAAGRQFATYDALRAAMAWDSGMLAFVPLSEVRVGQIALAIDGADIVRGRGDLTSWPFVERVSFSALTTKGRTVAEAVKAALTATPPKVTRIVATGDILQSRCSLAAIEATGDWGAAMRGPVGDYLAAADLALGSLDGSITDFARPYGCVAMDYPNLTSPAQVIEALTLAGIDEVTVATNHIYDCGKDGPCGSRAFLRTLELLHTANIKTVGGGANLEEALAPAIFEVNGVKFGVLGFDDIAAEDLEATDTGPGTAPLDDSYADEKADMPAEPAFYKPASMLGLERFTARIKALKEQVDVVIVQVQTGFEDTHEASPRSIKALRAAVAAGADLVVGNQGHHVQPVEVIGDAWVSYALGNFIFDQTHTPAHTEGYLLEASFWGKQLANVRMVPYHIVSQYKPVFVDGAVRAKILGDVMDGTELLPKP